MPPLILDEREQYYAESKRIAALFGIPSAGLPQDWAAFSRYNAEMIDTLLGVGEDAISGVDFSAPTSFLLRCAQHPTCVIWFPATTRL